MSKAITLVGVIGTGTMGSGIAEVMACAGFQVFLWGRNQKKCAQALATIRHHIQKNYSNIRGVDDEREDILPRITGVATLEDFDRADLIIEAVSENVELKKNLFRTLDRIAQKNCIFASMTSSIPITVLAEATQRPDKCIGMHFFNPPNRLSLMELIRGKNTSSEVFSIIYEIAKRAGRDPIIISRDEPGFVVNRILMRAINEAAKIVEDNIATPKDVNESIILAAGSGKAMPVLHLIDLIGIDICVDVLKVLAVTLGPDYEPAKILKKMVAEGNLGRKSGRGFFEYGPVLSST